MTDRHRRWVDAVQSHNKFSDSTKEQLIDGALFGKADKEKAVADSYQQCRMQAAVPESVDWRSKGVVTPVKNQRNCGSGWAFAAIAAAEGIIKILSGKLVPLSEQELVDCDRPENRGCEGGSLKQAFRYVILESGGVMNDSAYPYAVNKTATCRNKGNDIANVTYASGLVGVGFLRGDVTEEELRRVVACQPVAVEFSIPTCNDDLGRFMSYKGGVFSFSSTNCGGYRGHAFTIVWFGRNTTSGTNYWWVKNSFGTHWGEGGYMRIASNLGPGRVLGGLGKNYIGIPPPLFVYPFP